MNTLIDQDDQPDSSAEAWSRLRGALKDVFAKLGGGEAYLRAERSNFHQADGSRMSAEAGHYREETE